MRYAYCVLTELKINRSFIHLFGLRQKFFFIISFSFVTRVMQWCGKNSSRQKYLFSIFIGIGRRFYSILSSTCTIIIIINNSHLCIVDLSNECMNMNTWRQIEGIEKKERKRIKTWIREVLPRCTEKDQFPIENCYCFEQ